MIRTIADQWLAQNAGRRYPFADDADTGGVPDSAVLDFSCVVYGAKAGETAGARLSGLTRGDGDGDGGVALTVDLGAYGTLDFAVPGSLARNTPYVARAVAADGLAHGAVTVTAAVLDAEAPEAGIPFSPTTVACDSLKVESVQAEDGETLTGEIVLDEGHNAEPYLDGRRLRLDVAKGNGIGERCRPVGGGGQTCDTVLFTINGEKPGSDGEIRLVGRDGVVVTPVPAEHAIEISLDAAATAALAEECPSACEG